MEQQNRLFVQRRAAQQCQQTSALLYMEMQRLKQQAHKAMLQSDSISLKSAQTPTINIPARQQPELRGPEQPTEESTTFQQVRFFDDCRRAQPVDTEWFR